MTEQLGYLGIDQWGNHFKLEKHPRKELMEQLGYSSCSKMYVDTKDERVKHVGYVIGNHWINVYRVFEWKDAE